MTRSTAWITASTLGVLACFAGSSMSSLAQETQQKPISLKLQLRDADITKVTELIALDEGIFKKNGLDVDLYIAPSAAQVNKRRGGPEVPAKYIRPEKTPIWLGGSTPTEVRVTTSAAPETADAVILLTLDPIVHWKIMGKSAATKLEDLKGKRVGSGIFRSGTMGDFIMLALCKKMGWDPLFDIPLIADTGPDDWKKGSVDAVEASELPELEAQSIGWHTVVDTRSLRIPIGGSGVMATKEWVKNNREATRRVVKSVVEAVAVMKQHKEVAFRAIAKWFGMTDPKMQEFLYNGNFEMPAKPYPAVEGIKYAMQVYDSLEMRKHKPEDFYDDSFIRELDNSGFIDSLYKQ